jgi:hypothetical protein
MTRITVTLLTLAALASQGCASFRVQTPSGFAELDDNDDFDYRATSADGVVVAVRAESNNPTGNLEFWSRAVDERLRAHGYSPEGEARPVRSASGLQGVQFRYGREVAGRPLRYWVTVFVRPRRFLRPSRVFIVEAGGDREVFDRAAPSVERAIASFDT